MQGHLKYFWFRKVPHGRVQKVFLSTLPQNVWKLFFSAKGGISKYPLKRYPNFCICNIDWFFLKFQTCTLLHTNKCELKICRKMGLTLQCTEDMPVYFHLGIQWNIQLDQDCIHFDITIYCLGSLVSGRTRKKAI